MPRDSGGTYTLPVSNPVTSGTIITSTWANATMPDLGSALTDSLSRTGNGAMQAALKHVDGGAGTPSQTFNDEPTSGRYRAGTSDVRDAVLGQDVSRMTIISTVPTHQVWIDAAWVTVNPNLKLNLTGGTVTGQIKGITPIADADLARKDYVDAQTAGSAEVKNLTAANGNVRITQRGTAVFTEALGYTADHWKMQRHGSDANVTIVTVQPAELVDWRNAPRNLFVQHTTAFTAAGIVVAYPMPEIDEMNDVDVTYSFDYVLSGRVGDFGCDIEMVVNGTNIFNSAFIDLPDTAGAVVHVTDSFNFGDFMAGLTRGVDQATFRINVNATTSFTGFQISNLRVLIGTDQDLDIPFPLEEAQLELCERTFERQASTIKGSFLANSTTAIFGQIFYSQKLRVPTLDIVGTFKSRSANTTTQPMPTVALSGGSFKAYSNLAGTGGSGLVQGNATELLAQAASYIDISAEL